MPAWKFLEQFSNLSFVCGVFEETNPPMKNGLFLSLIVVVLLSCQKDELKNQERLIANGCSVSNPIEDLPWLKAQIHPTTSGMYCIASQVIQGEYQGKAVFIIPITGSMGVICCTCAGNAVYDCEGNLVFVCDTAQEAKITNKKVLWER
jgi:hypothetical protein